MEPSTDKPKTREELIQIHKDLHNSLDILIADFISQTRNTLTDTSLMELIEWSHQQTINPSCYKSEE